MPVFNFKEWLTNLLNENFKTQREKFIKQGFQPAIVDSYINNFKIIREKKYAELSHDIHGITVPKEKRNDIDAYPDFHQLEIVVDYIKGQREIQTNKPGQDTEVDGTPVYKENGIEIYHANSARACIKIKGDRPYSWCVARNDSSNMYNTYRYKENQPAFYFVKSAEKPNEDPYHFFVVQVTKNNQYIVTSARNDGDKNMSWNDIVEIEPKLDGLQNMFKPVPLADGEIEQYNKFINGISDEEFKKLTYKEKSNYLDIYVHVDKKLTDSQFTDLPEDLKNKYIGFGVGLTDEQYETMKNNKKLKGRYLDITLRKMETSDEDELTNSEKKIYHNFVEEVVEDVINEKPVPPERLKLIRKSKEFPYFIMKAIKEDKRVPRHVIQSTLLDFPRAYYKKELLPKIGEDDVVIMNTISAYNINERISTQTTWAINDVIKNFGMENLKKLFLTKVPSEKLKADEKLLVIPSIDKLLTDENLEKIFFLATSKTYVAPIKKSILERSYNIKNNNGIFFIPVPKDPVNVMADYLLVKIEIKDLASLYLTIHDNPQAYDLTIKNQRIVRSYDNYNDTELIITSMTEYVSIPLQLRARDLEKDIDLNHISSENLYNAWKSEILYWIPRRKTPTTPLPAGFEG